MCDMKKSLTTAILHFEDKPIYFPHTMLLQHLKTELNIAHQEPMYWTHLNEDQLLPSAIYGISCYDYTAKCQLHWTVFSHKQYALSMTHRPLDKDRMGHNLNIHKYKIQ